MNVFFADLRDIGSGEDGEGWVCLGVAILIVGYFTYDGIICSKWWKNRGKTKEQIEEEEAELAEAEYAAAKKKGKV